MHDTNNTAWVGGGGVALFWKTSWTLEWSTSLSPRLLLATLRNDDGQLISVICAHLHHKLG